MLGSAATLTLALMLGPGAVSTTLAQDAVAPAATAAPQLPAAANVTALLAAPAGAFTVGDPVELTLRVTHPAGTQVILPRLEQTWGDFEVRDQQPPQTTANDDGTLTTEQTIVATLFATGDFTTPPLTLTVSDAAGQLSQAVAAPATLSIGSVLAEGDSELRDIKPQAELEIPAAIPYPALIAAAAAAMLAALGFVLWRRWANQKPVDNRTPDQVAYDELARIAAMQLPAAGRFNEHYALTADCVRNYLERQFGIPASDRTTLEITTSLRTATIAPAQAQSLVTMLAECDLVKFARLAPGQAAATDLLEEARRFVMLTTAEKAAAASQASNPDNMVGAAASA